MPRPVIIAFCVLAFVAVALEPPAWLSAVLFVGLVIWAVLRYGDEPESAKRSR